MWKPLRQLSRQSRLRLLVQGVLARWLLALQLWGHRQLLRFARAQCGICAQSAALLPRSQTLLQEASPQARQVLAAAGRSGPNLGLLEWCLEQIGWSDKTLFFICSRVSHSLVIFPWTVKPRAQMCARLPSPGVSWSLMALPLGHANFAGIPGRRFRCRNLESNFGGGCSWAHDLTTACLRQQPQGCYSAVRCAPNQLQRGRQSPMH